MEFSQDFLKAVYDNLRLKSKILAIFFLSIVVIQIITMIYIFGSSFSKEFHVPKISVVGPMAIFLAALAEFYAFKFFKKKINSGESLSIRFIYFITALEVSFPSFIFAFIFFFLDRLGAVSHNQILTSPPFIMYFILIALSSLVMNVKLSVFAGFLAAIEYFLLSVYLLSLNGMTGLDKPNTLLRAALLAVFGVIIGFVSRKILESVKSSLESKNKLIYELDGMVKEKTKEITQQKEELAVKNKDITDSINYAKRIQTGILPQTSLINEGLTDYFILYKPKDIVSGDFYWASNSDTYFYIAACDCTGHGVPGAFMSMLGTTLLNQAVRKRNSKTPADILNSVNEELPKNLKSHDAEISIRDGMDIALCSINQNTLKLDFAGANNPCWIVRDGSLIELKADKQAITASNDTEKKSFSNRSFDLKKNDMVYLFTDGYADQFGGPKGKKFKYKQLEEVLIEISGKSTSEQHKILEDKIEEWKAWPHTEGGIKELEQIDDVLIIGIKI